MVWIITPVLNPGTCISEARWRDQAESFRLATKSYKFVFTKNDVAGHRASMYIFLRLHIFQIPLVLR